LSYRRKHPVLKKLQEGIKELAVHPIPQQYQTSKQSENNPQKCLICNHWQSFLTFILSKDLEVIIPQLTEEEHREILW